MSAKLVAYEYIPSGFEMVIAKKEVKAWNLWWNVEMTDDPEDWDRQIKSINKMQDELGELSADQRLIRAQIAEFCRVHPLFPQSIDILCKEIGDDRFSNSVKMGCEGRGLLDSLGYHDHGSFDKQRKEIYRNYVKSLREWLRQGQPETSTECKVFGFLGRRTAIKVALAEKLVQVVDSDETSVSSLRRLIEDVCRATSKDFETLAHTPSRSAL